MITLGDLAIITEKPPPRRLLAALVVISEMLHPVFTEAGFRTKDSCVLLSLSVRDFLLSIDFSNAEVKPVSLLVREFNGDAIGHTLGVGVPGDRATAPHRWAGHLVVTVDGWLIDSTLYQAQRKQWPELPGMIALRINRKITRHRFSGLRAIAGFGYEADGRSFDAAWFSNPRNQAWVGPDSQPWRRAVAVAALTRRFSDAEKAVAATATDT